MAEVLEANQGIAGVVDVADSVVLDLKVVGDTLLVLEMGGKVTAWDLTNRGSLGTVLESGAVAIGPYGYSGLAIVVGTTLHRYMTATGYLPVEVETMQTGLPADDRIAGIFQSWEGTLVLDEGFRGMYHDASLAAPITFDFSDDPVLETDPTRRGVAIRAATIGSSTSGNDVFIATTSRQILSLVAVRDYVDGAPPSFEMTRVMYGQSVPASVTALSTGPEETLFIGTDRGVEWIDVKTARQKEFPYAGWSTKRWSPCRNHRCPIR